MVHLFPSKEMIEVREQLNISRDELWSVITDPKHMVKWFFPEIPDFKPEVGFKTNFSVEAETQSFEHQWEILEVVPYSKIIYDWRYPDFSGQGKVTFSIGGDETTSYIILTCEGIESFPQFRPESCEAGWNYFIKERLKNYAGSLK